MNYSLKAITLDTKPPQKARSWLGHKHINNLYEDYPHNIRAYNMTIPVLLPCYKMFSLANKPIGDTERYGIQEGALVSWSNKMFSIKLKAGKITFTTI